MWQRYLQLRLKLSLVGFIICDSQQLGISDNSQQITQLHTSITQSGHKLEASNGNCNRLSNNNNSIYISILS